MSIVTRAVAKTYFETGDKPTQSQFIDLIDGAMFNEDFSTLGKAIVSAATTASAQNLLGIPGINPPGTVGNILLAAITTASAQTQIGVPTSAAQSDQETGTTGAKFVSPSVQQFHPSAAKAWARVNYSGGTPSLQSGSYNFTSVTDTGVGIADLNYTNALTANNMAPFSSQSGGATIAQPILTGFSTSALQISIRDITGTLVDNNFSAGVFGDL